ncbi:hypothetical protein K5Y32_16040 [Pantoea sp. DY-15]|uniref:hypothetical protein n=1 Tax=unclassified Pantoea TaxID=2630326 RepID=UPI001C971A19|nr:MULTISPECIES: hypothetical protein [unclassified Pantoea]MBY4839045.1 hypothetical protein [Pantoea sp. DY-5]MBY4889456.1 hypothetical protein [Pantoea sp. DY-15]
MDKTATELQPVPACFGGREHHDVVTDSGEIKAGTFSTQPQHPRVQRFLSDLRSH